MRQPFMKALGALQAQTAILTAFLPLLAIAALSGCQAPEEAPSSASTSSTSGIENGQMPDSQSLIAHTAIRIEGRNPYLIRSGFGCSGTVLSPTVVLTAGHCVTSEDEKGDRKLLPPENLSLINADAVFFAELQVAEVLVPDEYLKSATNRDLGYDIALIRLKQALPSYYRPAVIATDFAASIKKPLYSAGFGAWTTDVHSEDANNDGALAFGRFELNLESSLEAPAVAYGVNRVDSKLLKLRSSSDSPALCKGDSGGPVYYEDNGRIHVVGVNVAIQFHRSQDAANYRCANLNADEFASSVNSENLHFIADGFQKLAGQPLPGVGVLRPIEDDPATLDFFLKNGDTAPRKNEWLDLSALTASLHNGHLSIYPQTGSQTVCSVSPDDIASIQVPYLEALDAVELGSDGISAVALRKIKSEPHSSAEEIFRGKIKVQENTIVLAVLTPSGVVRASLTRSDCR